MNHKELQASRKLLMLDVAEAAEHIGQVSPRSWQYWETGRSPVPADVADKIEDLLRMRLGMIADVGEQAAKRPRAGRMTLRYFGSLHEFVEAHPDGTVLGWRLHQAVTAHYYANGKADLA